MKLNPEQDAFQPAPQKQKPTRPAAKDERVVFPSWFHLNLPDSSRSPASSSTKLLYSSTITGTGSDPAYLIPRSVNCSKMCSTCFSYSLAPTGNSLDKQFRFTFSFHRCYINDCMINLKRKLVKQEMKFFWKWMTIFHRGIPAWLAWIEVSSSFNIS